MPYAQAYYQTPPHVFAAGVVLAAVDILIVALRFWTRLKTSQPLKMDDWLMIPAMLLTVAMGCCLAYGVTQEAFAYYTNVPPGTENHFLMVTEQLSLTSKLEWAISMMLPLSLGCIKASVLFFYMRIFSTSKKSAITILLIGMLVLVAMWATAFFFATLFWCKTNFWAMWGTTMDLITQCTETMKLILLCSITDFITDVLIICIPIPLIWRLNLSTTKKVAVTVVFLLGAVSAVASMVRLIVSARTVKQGFDPNSDEILVITLFLYWAMVECGIGVFAACLPTLHTHFKGMSWQSVITATKSFLSTTGSRSASNTTYGDGTRATYEQGTRTNYADNVTTHEKRSTSTDSTAPMQPPIPAARWPLAGNESFAMKEVRPREAV